MKTRTGRGKVWDLASGTCAKQFDAAGLYKYDSEFMADIGGARGMTYDTKTGWLACSGITNVSNAFAGIGNPRTFRQTPATWPFTRRVTASP